MVPPSEHRSDVDIGTVVAALDDEDARAMIEALTDPLSASELAERCEVPLSTTYRKLDRLTDAQLLIEGTAIRRDGHHVTRYDVGFDRVEIRYDATTGLRCRIEPRPTGAPERLATMWSQIQEET
jgi:IclR helix-turn-helix domain.